MLKKLLALQILLAAALPLAAQLNQPIIPTPAIFRQKTGIFTLDRSVKIAADSAGLDFAAKIKNEILNQTGFDLQVQNLEEQKVEGKKILVKFNPAIEKSDSDFLTDGYFLKIQTDSIVLDAPTSGGLFYGLQTLRQIIGFDRHREAVPIRCLEIADAPGFDHRGVMFDVGRHFVSLDFLKKQVEALAFYKINIVRLHLTEDQGWRVEIKKHPELVRQGAFRREADDSTTGGFYTQDELRDFVKFCAERNITVIPEIEMPGHCRAALAALPQLSCRRQPLPVPSNWGVFTDVFCAGNDSTFLFLENVLSEILEIFPSKTIHIGGDEVPKTNWHNCPRCQQRIETEGLANEEGLQAYFVRHIQRFLESRGRQLAGWDEILEGGIDSTAIVQIWRGMSKANEALEKGHPIVLSPDSHCYLNRPPSDLSLENIFRFDPLADTFLLARQSQILGIEAPLWSENITEFNLENMLFPRVAAIAELAWTGGGDSNFVKFRERLAKHYPMLDSMQIGFGSESQRLFSSTADLLVGEVASNPDLQVGEHTSSPTWRSGLHWRIRTTRAFPDLEFFYILEQEEMKNWGFGLEKPLLSPALRFSEKLEIEKPTRIRFAPFRRGKQMSDEVFIEIAENKIAGLAPVFEPLPDKKYSWSGKLGLTDGLLGTTDFHDGRWLGWQGQDVAAVFDFRDSMPISRATARFLHSAKSWILLPQFVEFYTSGDGENWSLAWINENRVSALEEKIEIRPSDWEAPPGTRARFLKIVAKSAGKLPAEHFGAGGDSWIFCDEILIR